MAKGFGGVLINYSWLSNGRDLQAGALAGLKGFVRRALEEKGIVRLSLEDKGFVRQGLEIN